MTLAPALSTATAQVDEVLAFLADRPLVVLTGAGCSTDSGIPDYRGPGSPARTPMTYQEFVSGAAGAAALLGSQPPRLGPDEGRGAERRPPGAGPDRPRAADHPERRRAARAGRVAAGGGAARPDRRGRLPEPAGRSRPGARCTQRLTELNPGFAERHLAAEVRPDGDVDLDETHDFVVAGCGGCGGVLKPHVVFFGENVPVDRVERCYAAVDALPDNDGALLVAGSSLTVMSGFRFVRRAAKAGIPVVIVNRGADARRRPRDVPPGRGHVGVPDRAWTRGAAAEQLPWKLRQRVPGHGASERSRRTPDEASWRRRARPRRRRRSDFS